MTSSYSSTLAKFSSNPGDKKTNWIHHNSRKILIVGICLAALAVIFGTLIQINYIENLIQKHTWEFLTPVIVIDVIGLIAFVYLVFRKSPDFDKLDRQSLLDSIHSEG